MIRSRAYLSALVLAAVLGAPISVLAYGFLALVDEIQEYLFDTLPHDLFAGGVPAWWPVPWLALCGLLTALVVDRLPGNGGHSPALGFQTGGPVTGRELPAVFLAALATLGLGAVLGPEAPLIAIGGGLAALTVHLAKKDAPPMALTIMASAGSFAAVSTLLGSPLLGAFLIMEAAGIGGVTLSLVALPGLLASGIGAIVFVGMDAWTGLGTFSLALTSVPPAVEPTLATMAWAVPMGAAGAVLGWVIRWIGLSLRPVVHRRRVLVTTGLGLLVGATAMLYELVSGNSFTEVLFSGQEALPALVEDTADYSLGVLLLLVVCKTFVYGVSLSAFRGGPVFPAMFVGAVMGVAASHLPGMSTGPGDRHGHRRGGRRDAATAPDLDPAGDAAPRRRRHLRDTAGRGRGRGRLRPHAGAPRARGRDGAPHPPVRMARWQTNPGTPTSPPSSAARSMPRG